MRWLFALAALLFLFRREGMAFSVKPGVFGTLRDEMTPVLNAIDATWRYHGLGPFVITSIEDGSHASGSLHFKGLAVDVRLNTISPELHEQLAEMVRRLSGSDFDIVHEYHGTERDHLHVEYDPS